MPSRLAAFAAILLLVGCTSDSPAMREAMTPAPPDPPEPAAVADLAGRKWVVDELTPSAAGAFEWSRLGVSLELDTERKTVSGFAGCNRWSAGFTSTGPGAVTFTPAATTRMACAVPEGVMQRESEFLGALSGTHRVSRSDDRLYLDRADGGGQIVLILDDV